jgi:hypothetical protein
MDIIVSQFVINEKFYISRKIEDFYFTASFIIFVSLIRHRANDLRKKNTQPGLFAENLTFWTPGYLFIIMKASENQMQIVDPSPFPRIITAS